MTAAKLRICPVNYYDQAVLTDTPAMLAGSPVTNTQLQGRDFVAQSTGVGTQEIKGHFNGNGFLSDTLMIFRHTGHGGLLRYLIYNSMNCTGGNFFPVSEDFRDASWTKFHAQPTAQSVYAPDGVSAMQKFIDDTNNSEHIIYAASMNVTSGVQYFDAIFVQVGELPRIRIRIDDVATNLNFAEIVFNVSTGAVISTTTGGSSPPTAVSGNMTAIPNADGTTTYRCALRFTPAQTAAYRVMHKLDNGTTSSYAGSGTGLYIWGAHFGKGATENPYSKTTGTAEPDDGTFAIYDSGWMEIYRLVSLGNMEWMGNAPLGFSTTDMLASESAFCLFHTATGISGFRLTFTRCQYHYWLFTRIFQGKYVEAPYNPKIGGMEATWQSNTTQSRTKGTSLRTNPGDKWRDLKVDMFTLDETQRPIWRDLMGQISLEKDVAISVFPGWGGRQERDFVFNAQQDQTNPFSWSGLTMNEMTYHFTEC